MPCLKKFHPDYNTAAFTTLSVGPNKGDKVPKELGALLEGHSRLEKVQLDLQRLDYDVDVLIIGGGGAGASAALEANKGGAKVLVVTKLKMGYANTMMAEGGIQAADKANDSPAMSIIWTPWAAAITKIFRTCWKSWWKTVRRPLNG
jgi:hypothetical protein